MNHCMVIAFATAFGMTEDELIQKLGHDGKGVFPGSQVQRTHHVQEMIDVGFDIGCLLVPVELLPQSTDGAFTSGIFFGAYGDVEPNFDRFRMNLNRTPNGVIMGMRENRRVGHAVYWDGKMCVDSSGRWELWGDRTNFIPSVLWRALWIR